MKHWKSITTVALFWLWMLSAYFTNGWSLWCGLFIAFVVYLSLSIYEIAKCLFKEW